MTYMPNAAPKIGKIVSGGQTGVDRAALDVALERNIPCGGWCPKGRLAEDGPISDRYPLQCTESSKYSRRTRLNVQESDGTLILTIGRLTGGTALTKSYAVRELKPHLVIDLASENGLPETLSWLKTARIETLNVAGPRASSKPEIYEKACTFLRELLEKCEISHPADSPRPGRS